MSSFRRRNLLFLVSVAAVVTAAAVAFDGEGLKKDRIMRDQADQLKAENAQLEAEISRLNREAQALHSSPAALERAAREELRFIRPGEYVYRLDAQPGGTP